MGLKNSECHARVLLSGVSAPSAIRENFWAWRAGGAPAALLPAGPPPRRRGPKPGPVGILGHCIWGGGGGGGGGKGDRLAISERRRSTRKFKKCVEWGGQAQESSTAVLWAG